MSIRSFHHRQLAMPPFRRFYADDPFGNRLEFVASNDG